MGQYIYGQRDGDIAHKMTDSQDKLPTPEEITDFPWEVPGAKVMRKGAHIYVVEYYDATDARGKAVKRHRNLGRVVGNSYVSMADFQKKYLRGGKERSVPEARQVRRYTMPEKPQRRHKPTYQAGLPSPEEIQDFPAEVEKARVVRQGKSLYVVTTEYYRSAGVNRHIHHYLGRIKDGRFYTMADYRRLFDRHGNLRAGATAGQEE